GMPRSSHQEECDISGPRAPLYRNVYSRGSLTLSIDDSFSPSWAAHNSDLMPHGCHRTVGRRVALASRFRPPSRATREERLPEERRQAEPSRRRVSYYWHRRPRRLGGGTSVSRLGEPQRVDCRSFGIDQPVWVRLVRRIPWRFCGVSVSGAALRDSSA